MLRSKLVIPFIICLLLLLYAAFQQPIVKERFLQFKYDLLNENVAVESKSEIDQIFNSFEHISYNKLDKAYLQWTKSDEYKYKKLLKDLDFRIINQKHFFKKIVGDFRIKDFVCRDSIYKACLFDDDRHFYWLIDKKLLYAVLEIQQSLTEKGYNKNAFWLRYGHRHPKVNEAAKAASLSRHIKGEAVDMVIQDINRDGYYSDDDKQIVLDIAEQEVIGNKGGIGRYPDSRTIHIDVRGRRARWDSY